MPWGLEKRARLRARGDDLPCQAGMTETISFGKPEPDQGRPTTELPWSRLILTSTAQVTRPLQVPFAGHFRNSSVFLCQLCRVEQRFNGNGTESSHLRLAQPLLFAVTYPRFAQRHATPDCPYFGSKVDKRRSEVFIADVARRRRSRGNIC